MLGSARTRTALSLLVLGLAAAGFAVTAPHPAGPEALADMTRTGPDGRAAPAPGFMPDAVRGATLFAVGGCTSCHETPRAEGDAADGPPHLGGGRRFETAFGVFIAPNISPDLGAGIGAWTDLEFYNAMTHGIGPGGEHLYPSFPWIDYARLTAGDVADLRAHIDTLPAVAAAAPEHEVPFPFNIRRGLGAWKLLFADTSDIVPDAELSDAASRGRFLVEGPGHCGECHTPRNALGALDRGNWLAGAPSPDGPGRVPDITPRKLTWSEAEIASYLKDGFTPTYDSVGGAMVEVVSNTAQLTDEDRAAIAAYLKAVPNPG
ncbi:MAG: mono/diheme cytochrome c family protein [Paracoccaceae bacterium]|jgi:mono/diheme cytochrome c family protein